MPRIGRVEASDAMAGHVIGPNISQLETAIGQQLVSNFGR